MPTDSVLKDELVSCESYCPCPALSQYALVGGAEPGKTIQRSNTMLVRDFLKPWHLVAGLIPIIYGAVLIAELPHTLYWLILAAGVTVAVGIVAIMFDYPLLALWPAFASLFLLSACVGAILDPLPDYAVVPVVGAEVEIWVVALLAIGL